MKDPYETILERKEDALVRSRIKILDNAFLDQNIKQQRLVAIDTELTKNDADLEALRMQRSIVS